MVRHAQQGNESWPVREAEYEIGRSVWHIMILPIQSMFYAASVPLIKPYS